MIQKRGGDPSDSVRMLQELRKDPDKFLNDTKAMFAMTAPKDKYDRYKEFTGQTESVQGKDTVSQQDFKYYQELKKGNPEAAKEFGMQKGYVSKEGRELSVFHQKNLDDAQTRAMENQSAADKLEVLADKYETNKDDLGGGLFGSAQSAFKKFIGGEDEVTNLKSEYTRIKNSEAIKALPQGPATDKDIEIFMKGFPSENSDPEYIASFLRGMSKANREAAKFNEFKANFISEKGHTRGLYQEWKKSNNTPEEKPEEMKNENRTQAPQGALDMLAQNPDLAEQFKAKYGYLPEAK
jgi:hypothetical protein